MNGLTVGHLEEQLRKFPKGTTISLTCNSCHHGSIGDIDIINIVDNTDQTYGYIELVFNNKSTPNVELSKDREEFYKKEIQRLNDKNDGLEDELERFKSKIDRIQNTIKSSW